jgi:hypothetical protein
MVKKFIANCDFGGQVAPVDFYVGNPAVGSHPLAFQSKWLSSTKRGVIPHEIMDSFAKLVEISEKNRIPFEDLCEYVIAELQSTSSVAKDAKKATALSSEENNNNKNDDKK